MPSPSNPSPRRVSNGSSKSAAPRPRASKTGEAGAPKIADVGSKRRALKKRRARQSNWAAWTVAGAITVAIIGAGAGIWTELGDVKTRVAQKRATLNDLNIQLENGRNRLRALASASGRERVLVENGFIKPGERLLLFPKETAKK